MALSGCPKIQTLAGENNVVDGTAIGPAAVSNLVQMFRDEQIVLSELLHRFLDLAIEVAGADKGMLHRLDAESGCLKIVASQGFSDELLKYFGTVDRNTNTTCAAALQRRMRVVVNDIATSYLFVGTPELAIMRAAGVAAAHSTPIIGSSGRFWGVFTVHFCHPQPPDQYDPTPLDRLAVLLADFAEGPDLGASHRHMCTDLRSWQ
jgi:GAF domain-containing protein